MAEKPKRVWNDKSLVFSNKKAVWKLWDKVWVYDPNFKEVNSGEKYPDNRWENVAWSSELQISDWLWQSENIWTFEDGIVATYTFKNYDGTVLKTGTVKDWETPVAPANPTRPADAWYTYEFSGWQPTVWPINKDTEYMAQYTATPRNYTVTIESNNTDYGTVDTQQVTVAYWTEISASSNVLTIWGATATATPTTDTAQYDYEFTNFTINWTAVTETTVQWDTTIVANFTRAVKNYTITVSAWANGSVSPASVTAPYGTTITQSTNTLVFSNWITVTATADNGYAFDAWSNVPTTVTANATVSASFVASQPSVIKFNTDYPTAGLEYVANVPIEIYESSFSQWIEIYNSNNSLVSSTWYTWGHQQWLSPYVWLEAQASWWSCYLRFNTPTVQVECVMPNNYWGESTTKTNFETLFGGSSISWESWTFESAYDLGWLQESCRTIKGTLSLQQDSWNYYLPVDLLQWDYYFQNGDIAEGDWRVIFNVSDSSGNNPIWFFIAPQSQEPWPMD